jgi:arylsulfatase A-like enzyme
VQIRGKSRRSALAVVAIVAAGLIPVVHPAKQAAAAPVNRTLTATEDTQVNSLDVAANLGETAKMSLCIACGGATKRGFVKFDTSAIAGTVVGVKLRLYSTGAAATPIDVQETTRNWTEAGVNWNNAPAKGALLGQSTGGEPAGYIEISLSSVGTGAYVLENEGSSTIRIATSETTTPPQLIVTTDDGGGGGGTKMNVLLIVTDDQRDWPSTKVMMPKTARWLGDGGRTFTEAYVTTPSCCPSRSSIFSGKYVHNHGVRQQTLATSLDQTKTMQRYLKDAGYRTAMAGKFLNGWDLAKKPLYFDRAAVAQGGYVNEVWGIDGVKQQIPTYTTTLIGDKAIEYVNEFEANDSQPWFMYLSTFAPHKPHIPEPKYAGAVVPPWTKNAGVNDSPSDKPPYLSSKAPIPAAEIDAFREAQQRTLLSVDDMVDRVMKRLEATGELNNTIVIFTSDNGYHWGEHRYIGKFTPYMPSLHVPMLVRWPGRYAGGSTSANLVSNIDLAPTILSAAGLPIDNRGFDGRPFTAVGRQRLHLEYWFDSANGPVSAPTWRATLTPTYEFVRNLNADGTFTYEYYDLRVDPWQTTNLYADGNPANDPPRAPLEATMNTDHACAGTNCP